MKHFVFIPEMGGNLGHVLPLNEIAKQAILKGFKVSLVLPDLKLKKHISSDINIVEAPKSCFARASANIVPVSLSESLQLAGYTQIENLAQMLAAWRQLILSLDADQVFFDYAPTAQLSIIDLNIKKVLLGSPFCIPPCVSPMPLYSSSLKASASRLQKADSALISCINRAHETLQRAPIREVSDIFSADSQFIFGHRTLDLYSAHRNSEKYIVSPMVSVSGDGLSWSSDRVKLFVYLNTNFPFVEEILKYLKKRFFLKVFLSGPEAGNYLSLADEFCEVFIKPLDVDDCLANCDYVVSHGGSGLINQALSNTKPVIAIPLQFEQFVNAELLDKIQAGALIGPCRNWAEMESQFDGLNLDEIKKGATEFSKNYQKDFGDDINYDCLFDEL